MTAPVIVPMSPGEKPTETGSYVVKLRRYDPMVGEVIVEKGELFFINHDTRWRVEDDAIKFIARIYPERIEARIKP